MDKLANLRDLDVFPTFADLPHENDIDLAFFRTSIGFTYTPKKHWCLLAEITDVEFFVRLRLIVRDMAGREVPVAFYTDGKGREIPQSQLQRGHTVAILYAEQHGFLDFTIGIRLEESNAFKITPMPLGDLLRLNDKVHTSSTKVDGMMACHRCDQRKDSLQKCGKCGFFWYCNKECQLVGWKDKGHKDDCKRLRDSDLKAMLALRWNHFESYVRFPLQQV
ncbi:hypothetical protein VTN02DRAFT_5029 [Thermoascus thermophilus]